MLLSRLFMAFFGSATFCLIKICLDTFCLVQICLGNILPSLRLLSIILPIVKARASFLPIAFFQTDVVLKLDIFLG